MPNPDARELASLLVRKAKGDEAILGKALDDPDVPDDVLGFHVQQAIEKRLKAVLALHEIDFDQHPQHRLSHLLAGAPRHRASGGSRADGEPDALGGRSALSEQREEVLDRAAAREQMSAVRDWSKRLLAEDREQDETPSS